MDLNSREISVDSSTTLGQFNSSVMTGRSPDVLQVFLDSVYSRMLMRDGLQGDALPTSNQQCRNSEASAISGKRFYFGRPLRYFPSNFLGGCVEKG